MFRVGAKSFSLAFDGGRAAPYHILEKRKKFVGSLWLGLESLRWVLETWKVLRLCKDLKGFFLFLRTEYSTLELSCLQNNNGRFVELSEYHGGAQRGGIRVPEGHRGAGWDRFAMELAAFFLGKQEPAVVQADSSRNGRQIHGQDSRNFTALPKPVIEASTNFKSTLELTSKTPRVQLDPAAPRPTRKFSFNWDPFPNTLRITKIEGEKRQAKWVGLKYKAQGLAQFHARAFPTNLVIGPEIKAKT